ncbi:MULTISPECIES: hypothetical protein [unclassified Psychrobacter]|nr:MULTISPECIES: hypothetical protein [unclassified Psychrobacter]
MLLTSSYSQDCRFVKPVDQLQLHKFGRYYPRQDTDLTHRAACNV